jgi:hypothetical protein
VIFLFMNGAPSHIDTFDPKPALKKYEGTAAVWEALQSTENERLHVVAAEV